MSRPARPEVLAFLSDVKDNPDDPTPWLVLTDWLEEHGDEADAARAEYCRLCVDRLQPRVTAGDWEKGERRRDLFRRYSQRWLSPTMRTLTAQMERGLVTISWYGAGFRPIAVDMAADQECWAWVGGLRGSSPVAALLDPEHAPLLEQLCRLVFPDAALTARDIELLANCPALSRIGYLEMSIQSWKEELLQPLVESSCLVRLNHLRLHSGFFPQPRREETEPVRRLLQERFARVDIL
jgi:uncharacterized protein (TIGR02996 family)